MYKHILLATDLEDDAHLVVKKAKALQVQTGAKLSLVHVIEPLPGYGYAYMGVEDFEGQLIADAKKGLLTLAKKLGVSEGNQFLELGPTKSRILEVAEKIKVDLIICGSHGRHGLSLLLGSTANAILHAAKCDVLTVRIFE